jgi:acyl-CoA reductase-like NAD-dependent aldehyde dehydrogenase
MQSVTLQVRPLIDGTLSTSHSVSDVVVVNPSTGRQLATIPRGAESDVDQAVVSARRAFEDGRWRGLPMSSRKAVLHRFAEQIASQAKYLDRLDAEEMGKPVGLTFANANAAAALLQFHAEAIDKLEGTVYGDAPGSVVLQRRVPRGVVAAVSPWNFPAYNAVLKVAPPLAAGNCVVLKPSELSSRSALIVAGLALEAGLPPGVLNVVPGLGETVGRALALHHDVDMISFTGSTDVGKLMLQYSGQSNMKVVVAECGGKSPQIVFADGVDLDAVGSSIASFLLTNQGQICSVGSRLLVERSIESELIGTIVKRLKQRVIGDAIDPSTTFGPVVSEKQCKRVAQYIESGQSDGAELVLGGRRVLEESGGFFIEPTVFRAVSPTFRIAQEEIFGPVLSVIPFESEADAVRIANDTAYGLSAYVWTSDLSRGMRMAKAIRSSIWISSAPQSGEGAGYAVSVEPAGQSGLGVEGGVAGIESYLRRQLVWINHA